MDFYAYMNLLLFKGAEVMDKEKKDGTTQRGIFIPVDGVVVSLVKNMARVSIYLTKVPPNTRNRLYKITPYIPRPFYKKYIKDNGFPESVGFVKMGYRRKNKYDIARYIDQILDDK